MLLLTVLRQIAVAAAVCRFAAAQSPAHRDAPLCLSVVVPSYFSPRATGSEWDTLLSSAALASKAEHVLLVNPNSGPGRAPDQTFRDVVTAAHKTGQRVYGYVPTGYGKVPLRTAEGQVQQYVSWYGVDGIFVDEVSAEAKEVPRYYQPLATFVTRQIKGGGVTLNNGTYPAAEYARIRVPADAKLQIVLFEHDYESFVRPAFTVPAWVRRYPARMFTTIVYAVPAEALESVLQLSAARNFGSVYVTDKTLPNPYNKLPSYWSQLSAATQTGCGAQ